MTASTAIAAAIAAAIAQLHLLQAALDARDQQRRGFEGPVPSDADLRRYCENALAQLGGGR